MADGELPLFHASQEPMGDSEGAGWNRGVEEYPPVMWNGVVEVTRSPSPVRGAKRIRADRNNDEVGAHSLEVYPRFMGFVEPEASDHQTYHSNRYSPEEPLQVVSVSSSSASVPIDSTGWQQPQQRQQQHVARRPLMQTGCVPCLMKGIPCDPMNPGCKLAMSDDWNLNRDSNTHDAASNPFTSLNLFRPDTKWRRTWRERHSLNFFVNFSAPQMAGFFDSTFWQRMVIQTSYYEPAILHAITAIGALHECIMQRAFADEKRRARAIEFALGQCNQAISCLTTSQLSGAMSDFAAQTGGRRPNSKIALITCVLFTCFEAMQGRCDSAVNHALQGRRLLQATSKPTMATLTPSEEDDLEQMRPIVERLEVQATALLDRSHKPELGASDQVPPLPALSYIYGLDHAHTTLHTALNSVMRFMQRVDPSTPQALTRLIMQEKQARYGTWFVTWETAFTAWLTERRETMVDVDVKRAMVLKANHLVGTMLASVDQSAGPTAYDQYEAEFRAIVDLAREVLASFSCPPLPTLTGGSSGTPYLSFSLWVTDPLWMAVSRCRNPSIRQAAFTLLSQNPRQEGIWHAGPQLTGGKHVKPAVPAKEAVKTETQSSTEAWDSSANLTASSSTLVTPGPVAKRARTYSERESDNQGGGASLETSQRERLASTQEDRGG